MALSLPRQSYDLVSRESSARAAFEYDTMVPIKSDTLKRGLAKDRIQDEGLEINCRDKNESSDNELDGEPAAKLRRGGGRRKQSKPMKMFAELGALPDSDLSQTVSNHQVTSNSKGLEEGKEAGFLAQPASGAYVCELCHEYFHTTIALREHLDQIHMMGFSEETAKDMLCPTKYHLLGKELIQESDFELVGKDKVREAKSMFSENKDLLSAVNTADEEDSCQSSDWAPEKKEEEAITSGAESLKISDRNHHTARSSPAEQVLQTKLYPAVDEPHSLPVLNLGAQMESPSESSDVKKAVDFGASIQTYEAGAHSEMHSQASISASWDPAKSHIFHPDAYCDICDREFCNKYFLKTHKANKHGIYDNNMTGMELSTSVSNDLFYNMLSLPPNTTPPKSSPQKQITDPIGSLTGLPLPLLSTSCGSGENSGPNASMKSSFTDSDECCEVCQKHFVSKSQLKRHKQEIHGLSHGSDTTGRRSSIGGLSAGSPTSIPASASLENSSTSHPLLLSQIPTTSSCSVPNALSNFGRMGNLNSLMFLNPFNPSLAVIPPLFPTPGLGFRPNALALPQLPLQDVQKGSSNSRFPNGTSAVPSSLLQSMGVLNAEALMELYRKEFCNSYLMRSQEMNSRTGLFTSGMAGFQPGMPTSLAGSMPFPLPGKLENQDSVKANFEMSTENAEVCEVCKKTFVSKQSLVSHILSAHHSSQDSCDLASELMKLDKLTDDHHFEKTIFNNMAAAKLVDRVQCDICSKEVCNKYFLKTHKIKVHGWDPVSGEREMPDKSIARQPSPPHSQNAILEPLIPDLMNVEKPKEEELLQMGIDPEAYCEICKKEFCNKYFLKTHKQNIHGIKTNANPTENRTNPMENWNFPPTPVPPSPLTATQLGLLTGNQQLQSLAPVLSAPPSLMSMLDTGSQDGTAEKRSWKWKEPVNAMRVTCEICNKILCNKYFLKTHMMKRHGVNYDTITGQMMSTAKSQALSDYAPMRDEARRSDELPSSQQTLLSTVEKQYPMSIQAVVGHSGIPDERSSPGEVVDKNVDECSSTACRTTERHDRERRSSSEMEYKPLVVGLSLSETSKALDLTFAATTVMAKTWHVPPDHHHHEHEDQMRGSEYRSGNDSFTPGAGAALCRIAAAAAAGDDEMMYGEKDASKMQHSVKEAAFDGLSDASSPLSSSFEENRSQGCVQNFIGQSKFDGMATAETTKAAIANHIRSQQKKKLFRCTHCRERFKSRSQCELHIRSAHPQPEGLGHHAGDYGPERNGNRQSGGASSSNDSSSSANSLGYLNGYAGGGAKLQNFSSESAVAERKDVALGLDVISKQPVTYAQPIDPTNLSNILMQPFLLKEVGGESHFAASLVYLPALQKIDEPVSVTFSLTPILQH